MLHFLRQPIQILTASILLTVFAFPTSLIAQGHVVSLKDLQNEVTAASQARQHDQEAVRQFLSSPRAEKAIKDAGMDPVQVKTAVSTLSADELADLSSRAQKAQADFAAGDLSDRDLLLIILGIAALVLIIVAVR